MNLVPGGSKLLTCGIGALLRARLDECWLLVVVNEHTERLCESRPENNVQLIKIELYRSVVVRTETSREASGGLRMLGRSWVGLHCVVSIAPFWCGERALKENVQFLFCAAKKSENEPVERMRYLFFFCFFNSL